MSLLPRTWDCAFGRSASRARRFMRAREGAAALEFAIVAFPFFLFLFAVIEIALMFFVNVMIDTAALDAARKIRTGQMQVAGATSDEFWDEVCENIQIVAPCDGHLHLDVQVYDDFTNTRKPPPVNNGEFDASGLGVDFGEAGDIVLVRVYYVWDVLFPTLGTGLANLNGGQRLLTSTVAFRNEPFGELQGQG